ncbi:MAG: alpha/beta hydrolase [Burkholderiaceae bacterium]|nr:alpha/beta hydrolase [Burkholderiaceae bacterium]
MAPTRGAVRVRHQMSEIPISRARRRLLMALTLTGCAWGANAPAKDSPDAATPPAERSFDVKTGDGVHLNVLEARPATLDPSLPAILLVPGWCMPATIWQEQLRGLGKRFRTLALDPRGQGQSDVPEVGYEAWRRAGDLHDVLAPLPRTVLVAWSLGVLDALNLVDRWGESTLAGLVLVDNSVGEPPAPRPSDFIAQLRADRRTAVDHFVRAMFARPLPEARIESIEQSALKMPLEGAIALLSYPFPREHWRDIARSIRVPLCYCVTSRYLEQAHNLQRDRPATRVEWFEHAGHALFVDEPERFNRIVEEFARQA